MTLYCLEHLSVSPLLSVCTLTLPNLLNVTLVCGHGAKCKNKCSHKDVGWNADKKRTRRATFAFEIFVNQIIIKFRFEINPILHFPILPAV